MSGDAEGTEIEIERLFRAESARLTAMLTRILGAEHLALAEDATQDALLAALRHWPLDGIPSNPSGWLLQVARRRALDVLRRDTSFADREPEVVAELEAFADAGLGRRAAGRDAVDDDQLRMILLCCHPSLTQESRVALTLKIVAGFGVGEIARAFLADESAVAQRLVRAKRTLREVEAPFAMPRPKELPERLDAVLDVLYLMFNEGHTAHEGEALLRRDLCQEALRLTELLLTDRTLRQPRVHALAALFCFHAARLDARTDAMGALVRLPAQDRARWDRALIERGMRHLNDSADGDELTAFHLEAEIAGLHATAPSWERTDWTRIVRAYDLLLARTGSDVVALNRVVAFWQLRGPAAAYSELQQLAGRETLEAYPPYHAVRGELLLALGRPVDASAAFRKSLGATRVAPVRAQLESRLREATIGAGRHVDSRDAGPS